MRQIFVASVFAVSLFVSCSSATKIVKFPTVPDETYANPNLKDFFKANRNPNIVLRVPNNNDKATSNTSTSTDIILEVVNIDPSVLYSTNKVTLVGSKKEVEQIGNINYKEKGASVEYKVILVKNNEIAGTYKFNYKPCPNGCELTTFKFSGRSYNRKIELRETVEINTMEEFMKLTTKKLIASFRQS